MIELKKEQMTKARVFLEKVDPKARGINENELSELAEYLQSPWEMPTEKEISTMLISAGWDYPENRLKLRVMVNTLFERRNAALQPKPVDPRREKIVAILAGDTSKYVTFGITADAILAALDGEKP